ncbi:hypothetical protein EV426DRAFT_576859 [Tirmania nivea]|nr:hypothetical protein EV426DRAFT_576859 [Tirmania nivea]
MSTSVIKMQNTITAFKSRIPVACGHHRPESTKPFTSAARRELPGGMKSKIPILKKQMKNSKRQTLSSVTHSGADQPIRIRTGGPEPYTPTTTVSDSKRLRDSVEQG